MGLLPAQSLPAVPHVVFGIFNLAIPNILAWAVLLGVFLGAAWARLPSLFEPAPRDERSVP
jgi:hypothetical protein